MKWKNIKLGRKFLIAFGVIIGLLVISSLWSVFGISKLVVNAGEVVDGNALRSDLEHKYVQHLLWAGQVSDLLNNDEVTALNVQMDDHKCDFGQWYYGEGKKRALELAPELAPVFDQMEEPHTHLHATAKRIDAVFVQADRAVGAFLCEAKSDHLIWINTVKDLLMDGRQANSLGVQLDPTLCAFGKWFYSEETQELQAQYPEFKEFCQQIEKHHNALHHGGKDVEALLKENAISEARRAFRNEVEPEGKSTLHYLNSMIAWNEAHLAGMDEAQRIYTSETQRDLQKLGLLFNQAVEESGKHILTDEAMLQQAKSSRAGVSGISLVAIILGIVLAFIMASGILKPIQKSVVFANQVSKGDLTATIAIDQQDEVGLLAKALRDMSGALKDIVANIKTGTQQITHASAQMSSTSQELSQGATEQASSLEEITSTMEEMTANIEQNTENAIQTENISTIASNGIQEVKDRTQEAVEANKTIAEKIKVINDIAFQTNILALNAAVEAARAGEHGKGFAVVAAEVRKLAENSKVAAEEIVTLAQNSYHMTESAGVKLNEMLPEIERTTMLVQEITSASKEQNNGATQVNSAMQQLNSTTQQSAASSEELASSAEELASQAEQLLDLVGYFKS